MPCDARRRACSCRKLEVKGPKWRHPTLQQVLQGVPFLRHMDQAMFDWFRSEQRFARLVHIAAACPSPHQPYPSTRHATVAGDADARAMSCWRCRAL